MSKKWEYRWIIHRSGQSPERILNEAGDEGWELVSILDYEDGGRHFILKRNIHN